MRPIARPSLPSLDEYVALLKDIWQSRMLSNFGKYADLFEGMSQSYLNNAWVRCVANCDIGLVLALAALQLPDGAECVLPSFTFNSTVNAVLWNRLRPVFVDIDPLTLNIDIGDVEQRISPRTGALMATHVFGSPCDIQGLLGVAAKNELPVVFDAAHAFGATYRGKKIGDCQFGDFQVFSFSATKPVTAAEGGLVAAGNEEYTTRIEYLRGYGFLNDYNSLFIGLNAKMSELHAALATLTLGFIEQAVDYRGQLAERYRDHLKQCPTVRFQQHLPNTRSTYKDFAILCEYGRDELAAHLDRLGVQTKKYFLPAHTMSAYRDLVNPAPDLADTEFVYQHILCLPIYNDLEQSEVDRISEIIIDFYRRNSAGKL